MYLLFDTETTGFPDFKKPLDDKTNARIVQLGAVLLDEQLNEVSCLSTLVKPDGWTIHPGAQAAHGITLSECAEFGAPIDTVLRMFEAMYECADWIIAHNVKFDVRLILTELAIAGRMGYDIKEDRCLCTMELTTPICKFSGKFPGKYKWPKLSEAYHFFFKEELTGAHDALTDVRATARILKHLVTNKLVQLAK